MGMPMVMVIVRLAMRSPAKWAPKAEEDGNLHHLALA